MKKSKKCLFPVLALTLSLSSNIISFANNSNENIDSKKSIEINSEISPYDMEISEGSHSGSEFESTKYLSKNNGKTINFYIENTGNIKIKTTINGKEARIFNPGEKGHITTTVTQNNQKFVFKAVPTPNGGSISMNYKIAQRN